MRARLRFRIPGEGNRHSPGGPLRHLLTAAAVLLTAYLLWYAFYGRAAPHFQVSVMLSVVLPFTFLTTTFSKEQKSLSAFDVVLGACALAVGLFYVLNDNVYTNWVEGISTVSAGDKIAAIALIVLTVEGCRRTIGWGLTVVLLAFLAYVVFGHYISGGLQHEVIGLDYFVNMQTMTTNGVFGEATQIVASYAFMFLLFGNFYHKSGGGRLFFDVAAALTRGMVGGPSKACVVSSGLYGSISGSPVADVATTGPITIRIMKQAGVPSVRAAAIEAAASSGGAILPPIMGSVVFIMADFTGIPYTTIAKSALICGVLYYFTVFVLVHFDSLRYGEGRIPAELVVGLRRAVARGWHHIIPIVILIHLILRDYTLPFVATVSILATIALSWFSRAHGIGIKGFLEACLDTVFGMAPLAMAVMGAGLIIGCIELTGLSGKFSILLNLAGAGLLLPSLIFSMVVLILLGMGMPTPAVYLMGAALIAPHLIQQFGLPVLGVHMWLVYFASMSAITPPVAVACFAAGAIAGANPMKVGFYACRLGLGGFILPFFFLFNPAILLVGSAAQTVTTTIFGAIMLFSFAVAFNGWIGKGLVAWPLRVFFTLLGVAIIYPSLLLQVPASVAVVAMYTLLRWRAQNQVYTAKVA